DLRRPSHAKGGFSDVDHVDGELHIGVLLLFGEQALGALLLIAECELTGEREVPGTTDRRNGQEYDAEHEQAQGSLSAQCLVAQTQFGRQQRDSGRGPERHRLARCGCIALAHGRRRRRGGHALLPSVSPTVTGRPDAPAANWSGSTDRAIETLSSAAGARTGSRVASASAVAKPFNS